MPPATGVESSTQENARVVAALGAAVDGRGLELWTEPADSAWAAQFLASEKHPVIGVHPGSDWSCQQWLPARFAEVARSLQTSVSAAIVITGTADELDLAEEIQAGLFQPALNACGQTTFGGFVEVVRRLDLLICVNSAAAAVARAVGTPAVVLLGLEDARYTGVADGDALTVLQPHGSVGGGWCEFGRWGVLSSCNSPMCRGLGGLSALEVPVVVEAALDLISGRRALGAVRRASG
jgi:hypothetical protein